VTRWGLLLVAALAACDPGEPFAARVIDFSPGPGAGFGQEGMPEIVLGPPKGGGQGNGSLDVVSLGAGGSLELELGRPAVDEDGPDLLVFENPFFAFGTEQLFSEPCRVEVADDGGDYVAFACDPDSAPPNGCAGFEPVMANPDDERRSPTDPLEAGGDAFDLADVGLSAITRVRITDLSEGGAEPSAGCDIDAIAAVER
jgi:hypothetical protein